MDKKHQKRVIKGKIERLERVGKDQAFLVLVDGKKINFDTIYSVDNEYSPRFTDDSFNCDCV